MIRERAYNSYFSYFLTVASVLTTILMVLVALLVFVQPAQAQNPTYTVLHSFTAARDGHNPYGGVVLDEAGNLYGTTQWGGCCILGGIPFLGTVFKLDQAGNELVLHTFTGKDGANPWTGLVLDAAGNLYGAAPSGGLACPFYGTCGVVFKLDPAGNETVLHAFTGADGAQPWGTLTLDAAGNLYGTTRFGGSTNGGAGVVFKIDPAGNLTVLHAFTGADGDTPYGGVIRDAAGNLYGTTQRGGNYSCNRPYGCGVVFKLDPAGNETVLHTFTGRPDGAGPYSGLVRDDAGNLYGTTYTGGAYGRGVVFKLDPAGVETVLHAFTGGADGGEPWAGLIRDAAGNLYGTTFDAGPGLTGVVFKLDPAGNETVLHAYSSGAEGAFPYGGLVQDAAGNLYGTTQVGGPYGYGVVFKITLP